MDKKILMLICCLIPIAIIAAAIVFGLGQSYLWFGIILLCPLMHLFMMQDMHGKKNKKGKCH